MTKEIIQTDHGQLIPLDEQDPADLAFCREAFGFEAQKQGWFRERDRLYFFPERLSIDQARQQLKEPPPASILEVPPRPLPEGPLSRHLLDMPDGTRVTWIRHPSALPPACQPHWRSHTHLFVVENPAIGFSAYTSIFSYAHLEGADGRFRIFGPGGIRWIEYPSKEAAINDALDMSLAVAMKIQVVGTPCAGNKIAVVGDKTRVGPALQAIFGAYERMGIIVTSADLGLSIAQLKTHALPVAPTCLVPLGVYRQGIPSAVITADAAFAGLHAMAEALPGAPRLSDLRVTLQGIGEVGYQMAQMMLAEGTQLVITEADPETCQRFRTENETAFRSGQAEFLEDLDAIYDAPADIFVPCALRDILDTENLTRLKSAGIKMIGGPANNLFPDQVEGPWQYHTAGLPVVPYEGIGAGGVTGVAYSIMSGIFGQAPFTPAEKVTAVREYVARVMRWSQTYDLPAQVISDRILFRRALRRRVLSQAKSDQILERMRQAFDGDDAAFERDLINDLTKRGFFYGPGRMANGGWRYLDG